MYEPQVWGDDRSTVGKVKDVEVEMDDMGWGRFLRARMKVNLDKPLARGETIAVKNETFWSPFNYEKLLRVCFKCGKIIHGKKCSPTEQGQFGLWI